MAVVNDPEPDNGVPDVMRSVNNRIRDLAGLLAHDDVWQFLCECGRPGCHEFVNLTLGDYDARRCEVGSDEILAARHLLAE